MAPWIPAAIMAGGGVLSSIFGGGQSQEDRKIMPEAANPQMQASQQKLIDYFLSRMGQPNTPLPQNMPISANWHPNITDSSNIWRQMAGMGSLPSWQGAGGQPFMYGNQLPAAPGPMGQAGPRVPMGGPGSRDPYDPRSLPRDALSKRPSPGRIPV